MRDDYKPRRRYNPRNWWFVGKRWKREKQRDDYKPRLRLHGDQEPRDPESEWTDDRVVPAVLRNWFVLILVGAPAVLLLTWWKLRGEDNDQGGDGAARLVRELSVVDEAEIVERAERAERVAESFLAAKDPAERLEWVVGPERVRRILEEKGGAWAAPEGGHIERMLGLSTIDDRRVTAFVVAFDDGQYRLLEVIETAEGPKVSWESYMRYGTATWSDLLSGAAREAVVRVFVAQGTYYNPPFEDEKRWTCFQLNSPDLPHRVHAYAPKGLVREERMKSLVLGSAKYRQHMTLLIALRTGLNGEPLFQIERALAVGWVRGIEDVEEGWLQEAERRGQGKGGEGGREIRGDRPPPALE